MCTWQKRSWFLSRALEQWWIPHDGWPMVIPSVTMTRNFSYQIVRIYQKWWSVYSLGCSPFSPGHTRQHFWQKWLHSGWPDWLINLLRFIIASSNRWFCGPVCGNSRSSPHESWPSSRANRTNPSQTYSVHKSDSCSFKLGSRNWSELPVWLVIVPLRHWLYIRAAFVADVLFNFYS